jgi:putative SOS response-associated peptidase YedK
MPGRHARGKQRRIEAASAVLKQSGIAGEDAAEGASAVERWDDMGFPPDEEPSEEEYVAAEAWWAGRQGCGGRLIPADAYYEWTKSPADGDKDPWHIFSQVTHHFRSGLWAYNSNPDATSCTIITEPSAAPVNQIHDRQSLMLDPAYHDTWLGPKTPARDLKDILSHDIDRHLQFYRVWCEVSAAAINKQLNDYASLVEPIKLL